MAWWEWLLDICGALLLLCVLYGAGLIVRRRSAADARRNVVSLTPHGAAERRRLTPLVAQVQVELAAGMPAEQVARLRADLKTLLARPS